MSDLTDFLLARIAEDEAIAREATPGQWYVDDTYGTVTAAPFTSARLAYDRTADEDCWVIPESSDSGVGSHNLAHIARHDPARVVAECEAKRRIVAAHTEWDENDWQSPAYFSAPMDLVLALLALAYADHPDYREEWKP